MRLILLFVTTLFALELHAQYPDLLQNRRISWVAEYTADYELNPAYNTKLETEANLLELQHLINTQSNNGLFPDSEVNLPYYFSQKIHAGLKSGAFDCYADEQLNARLTPEQVLERFAWKDSTSADFVTENEYGTEAFVTFRVRQVFYYHEGKRQFFVEILALAPIPWVSDSEGNMIEHPPLLWIKLPQRSEKDRKNLFKSANYILQTRTQENCPAAEQLQTAKGTLDIKRWASEEIKHPSHQCLSADGFERLNRIQLQNLVFTADTVTALNDLGQSVIDRIIEHNALEDVQKIRFVQNWYFDEQRLWFDCQVVAVAPMATIVAAGGLFEFDKPLFYVKY